MQKEQIAKLLLEKHAVTLSPDKPYTYASGIKSPIYCDNRLLISYPQARKKVVEAFKQVIAEQNISFDVVAGTATAGITWAAWLAEGLEKPMVYVRSSSKEHGKGTQIEGKLSVGQTVLVIDDLITTAGSIFNAIEAIYDMKCVVSDCCAIFTYDMKEALNRFKEKNITLHAMTNISVLIDVAVEMNKLDENHKSLVLSWKDNPKEWGINHEE